MNRADDFATTISQAKAKFAPIPAATSFTAQTTGIWSALIFLIIGLYPSAKDNPKSGADSSGPRRRSLRSWPTQKALPEPVIRRQRIAALAPTHSTADSNSLRIVALTALSRSGRLRTKIASDC